MFPLFLRARANNYFKARSANRDTETDHDRATSVFRSIEDALDGAKAEQAGLKSRLLLVGSEVLQIHKAVNRELVGIVLSALGKRCDVRPEQRPAIVITGNAVIERGEDAPYSVGHPFNCSLMHHERCPFGGPNN